VNVTSVIANSVGLTPRVSKWSKFKLTVSPFLIEGVLGLPYVSPNWSALPSWGVAKIFAKIISCFHRECNVPACHMLSMMWGNGYPALYHHENLDPKTHQRGGDLYGSTGLNYHRHVRKMVFANSTAKKYEPKNPIYRELPDDYFEHAADIKTPILFMTGEQNYVFTDSNIECFRRLEALSPGIHSLHVFPNYGHQDVFMGKNCYKDIFPTLVEFLKKQRW
jgi:lysosomal acid lipase/cholesteryl ester hydrolase